MSPAATILATLAVLAVCCAIVLVSPTRRCPKCKGKRVVPVRGRIVPCKRCGATGRTPRRFATHVHRAFWGTFGDPIRKRLPGSQKEGS